jgi:NADPH:quinone reductase-like Zn-dependent oxidoreductase
VRPGGTAVTTRYAADPGALDNAGVTGINFALQASSELLDRVADAVVAGLIVPPPITRITLDDAPAALKQLATGRADGKTVITL